jgi:hypothetical protein
MGKLYDLAVKVAANKEGKAVWKNIGVVMQGDKGPYLLLDRTFNPAGVPGNDNKQSIIVSMFAEKKQDVVSSQDLDPDQVPF